VRSRAISQGIVAAYQTYLKRDEFPICILVLEIDPRIVDVNVHPAKAEVKFADERGVVKFVVEALREALGGSHELMRVTATPTSEGVTYAPTKASEGPGYRPSLAGSVDGYAVERQGSPGAPPSQAQAPLQDLDVGLPSSHDATIGGLVPLVQTQGAWVICDSLDGIVLVDPHAAHERVLYEEFLARTRPVNSQRLVAPETVNLGRIEADAVKESLDILASIGFDVEEFGPNTFLIRSAPAESGRRSTVSLFDEVVHELVGIALQEPSVRPGPDVRIARCACKMAVKVGDPLSHAEIVEILSRLSRVENAYTCPHGRPTMFTITNEFIEQKFRRR
jgi:DNA mismatch repair protein MutL